MKAFFVALTLLTVGACSPAETVAPPPPAEVTPAALEVRDAWAAPTPNGVDVSAGYLTIAGGTSEDRLLSAASPRSASVEIHEMSMDGNVMRMRQVEALAVPAGGEITLAPGGLHLMFLGVTQPFAEGESIPVTLTFEHAGTTDVSLPVRRNTSGQGG